MPRFEITAPDGRRFEITGDQAPTEAELEELVQSVSAPAPAAPQRMTRDQIAADVEARTDAAAESDTWTKATSAGAASAVRAATDPVIGAANLLRRSGLPDWMVGGAINQLGGVAALAAPAITAAADAETVAQGTKGNETVAEVASAVGSGLGSMPSALVPGAGPAVSAVSAGLGSYEQTRREAFAMLTASGMDAAEADTAAHRAALGAGVITGGVTGAFNAFGGRFGLGRGVERGLGGGVRAEVARELGRSAARPMLTELIREAGGEATEEAVDQLLQESVVRWQYDKGQTLEDAARNVLKAGLLGGVAGGVIGGVPAAAGVLGDRAAAVRAMRAPDGPGERSAGPTPADPGQVPPKLPDLPKAATPPAERKPGTWAYGTTADGRPFEAYSGADEQSLEAAKAYLEAAMPGAKIDRVDFVQAPQSAPAPAPEAPAAPAAEADQTIPTDAGVTPEPSATPEPVVAGPEPTTQPEPKATNEGQEKGQQEAVLNPPATAEPAPAAPDPTAVPDAPAAPPAPPAPKKPNPGLMSIRSIDQDRPPDLIDFLRESVGEIRNKATASEANRHYYESNGWEDAARGSTRALFADGGIEPDVAAQMAWEANLIAEPTVDHLFEGIGMARRGRQQYRTRAFAEQRAMREEGQQADAFQRAAIDGKRHTRLANRQTEEIAVDDLRTGDEFELAGERVVVERLVFDDTDTLVAVELKDGRKFGRQQVTTGTTIKVDRGTVQQAGAAGGEDQVFSLGSRDPGFFDEIETVEQQKRRIANEKLLAERAAQREEIRRRQAAPIVGRPVDTTGDLFGTGNADAPLFAAPTPKAPTTEPKPAARPVQGDLLSVTRTKPSRSIGRVEAELFLGRIFGGKVPDRIVLSDVERRTGDGSTFIEGILDRPTGRVTLFLPNITGEAALRRVLRHELLHDVYLDPKVAESWRMVRRMIRKAGIRAVQEQGYRTQDQEEEASLDQVEARVDKRSTPFRRWFAAIVDALNRRGRADWAGAVFGVERLADSDARLIVDYAMQLDRLNAAPTRTASAKDANTEDDGLRFSLRSADEIGAEVDHDLVALHNTTAEGVRAAARLGGIPVPSLAVTRTSVPFESYGDITLIADRSAVDPQADARNLMFGADVYSPRQPRPTHKLLRGAKDRLSKTLVGLLPPGVKNWWDIVSGEPSTEKVRESGPGNKADTLDAFVNADDVRVAFLRSQGVDVPIPRRFRIRNEVLNQQQLSDPALVAAVKRQKADNSYIPTEARESAAGIAMARIVREMLTETFGDDPEFVNSAFDGDALRFGPWDRITSDVLTVSEGTAEVDRSALRDEVQRMIEPRADEFRAWVSKLVDGMFDPRPLLKSGRKTVDYTLANVTEEMRGRVRQAEDTMTQGLGKARAGATPQIRSIQEARNRKGDIQGKAALDEAKKRQNETLFALVEELKRYDASPGRSQWDLLDSTSEMVGRVMKAPHKAAAIIRANGYSNVPADLVGRVREFARQVLETPTEYFEAKPQRAVLLNEFRAAVVPDTVEPEVVAILEGAGMEVARYSDTEERRASVERMARERNLRFSLRNVAQTEESIREEQARLIEGGKLTTPAISELASSGIEVSAELGGDPTFQQWANAMAKRHGETVRPLLRIAWDAMRDTRWSLSNGIDPDAQGVIADIAAEADAAPSALDPKVPTPVYDPDKAGRWWSKIVRKSDNTLFFGGAEMLRRKGELDLRTAYQAAEVRKQSDALMERLEASIYGDNPGPIMRFWRQFAPKPKLRRFMRFALPIAARLNITGGEPGAFEFQDFNQRAGFLPLNRAASRNLESGQTIQIADPITGKMEELEVGTRITLEDGREGYQLLRPMPAAQQRAVYQWAEQEFPEFIWLLNTFVDPRLKDLRIEVNGVRMPVFNRMALAGQYGETDPGFRAREAYTPDVYVGPGVLKKFLTERKVSFRQGVSSPGRLYETGAARESGRVLDLLSGFNVRAMQVMQEQVRQEWARYVIGQARDLPKEGMPKGWVRVETAMAEIIEADRRVRQAHPLDFPQIDPEAPAPEMSQQMERMFGRLARSVLRPGPPRILPRPLVDALLADLAVTRQLGAMGELVAAIERNWKAFLLLMPTTFSVNRTDNYLRFAMHGYQRLWYAALKGGDRTALREGLRLAYGTMVNIVPGVRPLLGLNDESLFREVRDRVLPDEIFAGDISTRELWVDTGDTTRRIESQLAQGDRRGAAGTALANLGPLVLEKTGYGSIDVRAKQQFAFSLLLAQAEEAAWRQGLRGQMRDEFVRQWMLSPPEANVLAAVEAAGKQLLRYGDTPDWLAKLVRIPGFNTFVAFPMFRYHWVGRELDRATSAFRAFHRVLVRGKKLTREQWAESLADTISYVTLPLMGYAGAKVAGALADSLIGAGGDDDEPKDPREIVGASSVYEVAEDGGLRRKPLPREVVTANRLNVSAMLRMLGVNAGGDQDYWLQVKDLPLIRSTALVYLAAEDARNHGARAGAITLAAGMKDLLSSLTGLGQAVKIPAKVLADIEAEDKGRPVPSLVDPYATNVPLDAYITLQLLNLIPGQRQADEVIKWLDPTPRRVTRSKSLGYDPGVIEAAQAGGWTGLADRLARGLLDGSFESPLPPQGLIDRRSGTVAEPRSFDLQSRIAALLGQNVKPIPRSEYREALEGLTE